MCTSTVAKRRDGTISFIHLQTAPWEEEKKGIEMFMRQNALSRTKCGTETAGNQPGRNVSHRPSRQWLLAFLLVVVGLTCTPTSVLARTNSSAVGRGSTTASQVGVKIDAQEGSYQLSGTDKNGNPLLLCVQGLAPNTNAVIKDPALWWQGTVTLTFYTQNMCGGTPVTLGSASQIQLILPNNTFSQEYCSVTVTAANGNNGIICSTQSS
jgi:hypothetical protein